MIVKQDFIYTPKGANRPLHIYLPDHYYDSQDGNCYTVFMAVTNHGHEIRTFTNNFAWNFAKQFRRTEKGIEIVE